MRLFCALQASNGLMGPKKLNLSVFPTRIFVFWSFAFVCLFESLEYEKLRLIKDARYYQNKY